MLPRTALCFTLTALPAHALIHEQVAFDSEQVCWWSLIPPDPICPVLSQQDLTEIVDKYSGRYEWKGGDQCEGPYCLYSNRGFAGGRGIALITTQENHGRVKAVGEVLKAHNVSFNEDGDNLPYRIAPVEGKGEGLIATQPFKRGDPVMAHTPVLLVHRTFLEDLPATQQAALLDAAVASLPKPTAQRFMAQAAAHPGQHPIASRLVTNAFQLDLAVGAEHYGAFPELAKLNHDCRPNAAYHNDPATLMMITTAVRSVTPGEELTISYLDPLAPRAERQERAHQSWGFGCSCSQCRATTEAQELEESETRLREIAWIEAKLEDVEAEEVTTGLVGYLLGLYENERLHCCVGRAYALAARNINMLGHPVQAVQYAELAIEALKIEKGEQWGEVRDMESLKRNPLAHGSFELRKKNKA